MPLRRSCPRTTALEDGVVRVTRGRDVAKGDRLLTSGGGGGRRYLAGVRRCALHPVTAASLFLLAAWHAVCAATMRGQATLPNAARKFIAANNRSAPPRLLQLHLLSTPAPRHSYIAAFPLGRCRMWVSWTRNLFFLFFSPPQPRADGRSGQRPY